MISDQNIYQHQSLVKDNSDSSILRQLSTFSSRNCMFRVEKMATKIKEMKEVKDAINEELQTLKTAVDVSNLTKELQDTSKRFHDEIANLRKDEADFRSSIQKTLEEMRNLLKPPTDPKNVKPK